MNQYMINIYDGEAWTAIYENGDIIGNADGLLIDPSYEIVKRQLEQMKKHDNFPPLKNAKIKKSLYLQATNQKKEK